MWVSTSEPVCNTSSGRPRSKNSSPIKSQGPTIPKYHDIPPSRHSFTRRDYELPPELLLEAFYHLQEDKSSLYACSSVCRAWLPCARYYFMPSTFKISTQNAATLFTLFASPCCTLGQYFTHLTLDTRLVASTYDYLFSEMNKPDRNKMTFLLRPALDVSACLTCLSPRIKRALRSLVVRDVGPLGKTDFTALSLHIKRFQVMTRLELVRCRISSLSELFSVLEVRPTLRSVSFVDIACVKEDEESSEEAALHVLSSLPLTDLTLQTSLQTAILRRLMTQYSRVPFLNSLSLGGIGQTTADRQVTDTFLRMLGGSLKSLKIYLNKWIGVTLAHNYNLQSLTIRRYPFSISNPLFYPSIPGLISLLSQLAPDVRLLHLSIQFLVADNALAHLPWKTIGDSLRDQRFTKLRRLRVQCLGHGESVQESVLGAFPTYFKKRGILKVRCDIEEPSSDEL